MVKGDASPESWIQSRSQQSGNEHLPAAADHRILVDLSVIDIDVDTKFREFCKQIAAG